MNRIYRFLFEGLGLGLPADSLLQAFALYGEKRYGEASRVLQEAASREEVEVLAYTWAGERRVNLRTGGLELGDFDGDTFPEADFLWNAIMGG